MMAETKPLHVPHVTLMLCTLGTVSLLHRGKIRDFYRETTYNLKPPLLRLSEYPPLFYFSSAECACMHHPYSLGDRRE